MSSQRLMQQAWGLHGSVQVFYIYVMAISLLFFVELLTVGDIYSWLYSAYSWDSFCLTGLPCPASIWWLCLVILYLVLSFLAAVSWRPAVFLRGKGVGVGLGEMEGRKEQGGLEGGETVVGYIVWEKNVFPKKVKHKQMNIKKQSTTTKQNNKSTKDQDLSMILK